MKLLFIKTFLGVLDQKIMIYSIGNDNQYSLEEVVECPLCDLLGKVSEVLEKFDLTQRNYFYTNEKDIEDYLLEKNFELWEA